MKKMQTYHIVNMRGTLYVLGDEVINTLCHKKSGSDTVGYVLPGLQAVRFIPVPSKVLTTTFS